MNKLDEAKLEQIRKAMRIAPTLDLMIALWQQGLDLLKAVQERARSQYAIALGQSTSYACT